MAVSDADIADELASIAFTLAGPACLLSPSTRDELETRFVFVSGAWGRGEEIAYEKGVWSANGKELVPAWLRVATRC